VSVVKDFPHETTMTHTPASFDNNLVAIEDCGDALLVPNDNNTSLNPSAGDADMPALKPAEFQYLMTVAQSLASSAHGAKDDAVAAACAMLGCSKPTLYRKLKLAELQYTAQRSRRTDAGVTSVSDEDLQTVGSLMNKTLRANGKRTLPLQEGIKMLKANGLIAADVSASHMSKLMRERGLHLDQMEQDTAAISMRSLHPNWLWQVDASVCILYYLSNGSDMSVMEAEKFYRNRPANYSKIAHERLIRWVTTDHYSGNFKLRYYLGSENTQDMLDFCLWAFSKQEVNPFHGVPMKIMFDPGSAAKAAMTRNLFDRLSCELIINTAGNARGKGSVEKHHDIIERHFEGRLRFMHITSLAQLNAEADTWTNAFASEAIHTRHQKSRHALWLTISAEQLRIAPALDFMRELVTTQPEERRVANDLTISFAVRGFGSQSYDLRYVPGVAPAEKVQVVVNAYRAPAIDIGVSALNGEMSWMTVEPLVMDEAGFRVDAPIIGQEMRSQVKTDIDRNREAAEKLAYNAADMDEVAAKKKAKAIPFAGMDAMADVRQVAIPTYLPKRGEELPVAGRTVEALRLTVATAAKRLKATLGEAYTPEVYTFLTQRFGEAGVPEDQIEAICAQFTQPADTDAALKAFTGLRVVNGGGA
jgi:hypothetical protein